MNIHKSDTAVVFIDPQNEVLSEKGAPWPLLKESLRPRTIPSRTWSASSGPRRRMGSRSSSRRTISIPRTTAGCSTDRSKPRRSSPRLFARKGVLNLDGLEGSGADWLERFKPYIEDGKTIVVAPHRVWGPETNDLVLQLRKRKISKVILGGMLANMCVESHLRELIERASFEVAVAKDATAAPKHPESGCRLRGRPDQLRVSRTRRPNNGRNRQGDGANSTVTYRARSRSSA